MENTTAYILSKDLFFISKIKEVCAAVGCAGQSVKSLDAVRAVESTAVQHAVFLLDVEKPVGDLEQVAGALRPLIAAGGKCVCFFSHVHAELEAVAEGLDLGPVMPRSRFVKVLPDLLASL